MTNRFKGLDLVDRVPVELWMEVRNTAQETVTEKIPKKKKCKKAKWLSEEVLYIAEERREMKDKGECTVTFSDYDVWGGLLSTCSRCVHSSCGSGSPL